MATAGTIKAIRDSYGFIEPDDGGKDCFFFRTELDAELDFNPTLIMRRVIFERIETSKGPKALSIRGAQ